MAIGVELAAGSVLAGFRIEALLGRGGMGVVYRATQLSLERPVALKLISPELAAEQRFREGFLREARLAASLDHPHLLPVYEAGEQEGMLFLAMRLVEGASLAELLHGEGRLAPERAVRLVVQLAQALQAAHDAGLLHRDVKPANVLLAGGGDSEHAYLCDFGLARRLAAGGLTREGSFLGTAAYAAPEQIRGEPLDERADLYALACLLYECLTGEPPFMREDELALCWAQLHEPPLAPGSVDNGLARFDSFFTRGLAKEPDARFSSAAELAQTARDALATVAAPAAPAPAPAPRLPRPVSSFLGRERELQELLELLLAADVRLLTLTGPGGIGKTRLALRAGEEAAPAFPDGVCWVGLAQLRDPALVTSTIAQTLEAKRELAETIADKRLLLLLDNFEQVVDAAPELAALLSSCPNLSLLVTSRELLRVQGEREYPVPPLAEREAVSLFCARSRLEPAGEIAQLCARLDNLPLAVELAAARTRALSPAQIGERLSQRLDLLTGGRDADPRQQTLRATIEWSYDLLSEPEQQLFERLAVFAGGCTLEAAEEVAGADLDTLQSLVQKSLVRFTNERYWMLELIREYAADRLEASTEAPNVRRRHAAFFTERVIQAEPDLRTVNQRLSLKWFRSEHDNIRAALDYLGTLDDATSESRLVGQLWYFWYLVGTFREGRERLAHAFSRASSLPPAIRAHLHDGLSCTSAVLGDLDAARQHADASLDLRRRTADARGILRSLLNSALVAGDAATSNALYEELEARARAQNELWFLAVSLCNHGEIALVEGAPKRAEDLLEEGLRLLNEVQDSLMFAGTSANLAWAQLELGKADAARSSFTDAIVRSRDEDCPEFVVWFLDGLAYVEASAGDPVRAARLLGAAEGIAESIGHSFVPLERDRHERTESTLLNRMTGESLAEARTEGRTLTATKAVAYALESCDPELRPAR